MIVLVTGATGVLGRRVVEALLARAHAVRAMSRWIDRPVPGEATPVRADLETGDGLPDALDGVDAVVHCATDPRRHRSIDLGGTERLITVAARSGLPHLVYPGIVGSDLIPLPYYGSKIGAEERLAGSGLPWTVIRATQFHQLIWRMMARRARYPVMVVPRDTRYQTLDPGAFARRLVDAVESGPRERLPDVGGRHAYEARDLARSYLAATGTRRPVLRLNAPGVVGAARRAGANLTPNRVEDGESWNDFVARMEASTGRG